MQIQRPLQTLVHFRFQRNPFYCCSNADAVLFEPKALPSEVRKKVSAVGAETMLLTATRSGSNYYTIVCVCC